MRATHGGSFMPENTIWNIIVQVTSALRIIHNAGLSCWFVLHSVSLVCSDKSHYKPLLFYLLIGNASYNFACLSLQVFGSFQSHCEWISGSHIVGRDQRNHKGGHLWLCRSAHVNRRRTTRGFERFGSIGFESGLSGESSKRCTSHQYLYANGDTRLFHWFEKCGCVSPDIAHFENILITVVSSLLIDFSKLLLNIGYKVILFYSINFRWWIILHFSRSVYATLIYINVFTGICYPYRISHGVC